MKQTIAIDVDDVLSATNDSMREFVNESYGLNFSKEDYSVEGPYHGYWEEIWGVDEKEGEARYQAYLDNNVTAQHKTHAGAVEAINKLKKKYNLVIVTARQDFLFEATQKWLEQHFPKTFNQIEFLSVWSKNKEVTKGKICKEIKASYLIDDNVEHCSLAAEEGIAALLFGDFGWNRAHILPSGVTRVKNWQEVLEYFDAK
jgi:5'(3')-deoxyribonucleotidase